MIISFSDRMGLALGWSERHHRLYHYVRLPIVLQLPSLFYALPKRAS